MFGPARAAMQDRSTSERLQEYQHNTAFVGFMLLVCTAAVVYLTQNLSRVLTPLMWAAFTAMPLTGLISAVNPLVIKATRCCRLRRVSARRKSGVSIDRRIERSATLLVDDIAFDSRAGEAFVRLDKDPGELLLEQVNEPDWAFFPRCLFMQFCCRRRVRVKDLRPISNGDEEVSLPKREVNRIVNGWRYYIREAKSQAVKPGREEIFVEMFLDQEEHYPAIMDPRLDMLSVTGNFEVDTTHAVSYAFATFVALCFIMTCLAVFVWLLSVGTTTLTQNVQAYIRGGKEVIDWISVHAEDVLPKTMTVNLDKKAQEKLNEQLPELASSLLSVVEGLGFEILLFVLYLMFWTLEPLPVNSQVSGLFKTYLLQKSLVCLIFATLMSGLLLALKCPLWHILFLVAFLLNYIPEVGPVVCYIMMLPLILLDGNLPMSERSWNSLTFTIFFAVFKFLTGNIIEVQLYAKSGGDLMRMHPVVMLALMMLFQALMGMTGMFMTVPVMAAAKYYMLSMNMPPSVLDPLLACIEGTEQGPHMNFVEQQRARKKMESPTAVDSATDGADDSDEDDEDDDDEEWTVGNTSSKESG